MNTVLRLSVFGVVLAGIFATGIGAGAAFGPTPPTREAMSPAPIGEGVVVRVGRYGPYLEGAEPAEPRVDESTGELVEAEVTTRRVNLPPELAPDQLTEAKARELVDAPPQEDRVLGAHPETGRTIIAKDGRFGPYVTEVLPEADAPASKSAAKNAPKPRTASLFKSMSPDTVDLDTAVKNAMDKIKPILERDLKTTS